MPFAYAFKERLKDLSYFLQTINKLNLFLYLVMLSIPVLGQLAPIPFSDLDLLFGTKQSANVLFQLFFKDYCIQPF